MLCRRGSPHARARPSRRRRWRSLRDRPGVRLAFFAEGARVALLDLDGGEAGASSLGKGAFGITCDVTDEASVQEAVEAAGQALGGVDGLVNSAGVGLWRPLAELFEDWRRVHSIDLDGPFLVTRAALPLLRAAGGGAIVNLASGAGMRPLPNLAPIARQGRAGHAVARAGAGIRR